MITIQQEQQLRDLEQHTFYSVAKYLYLIRTEEGNQHARLISLMEIIPKYLSYVLIAEYKTLLNSNDKEVSEEDLLKKVAELMEAPSFGDWKEILRILLTRTSQDIENHPSSITKQIIDDVWRERKGLNNLRNNRKELYEIIRQIKPKYEIRKINKTSIRLYDLIEMLVTYRNAFYGHGDISNFYEYQQHNQVITDILVELIKEIQIFHTKKLVYLERVQYKNKKYYHEMYISSGRNIDFDRYTYENHSVLDPEQVYLCDEIRDEESGEIKLIPRLSMYPMITYTYDPKENNRNLLFLGNLKENHVGYSGFPSNYFYEPKDPTKHYESFLRMTNPKENGQKQNHMDGEIISASVPTYSNNNRTYDMIDPADNPQIWENFEDVYYAYNAPFQLEKNTDLDKLVDKHATRYRNNKLKKTKYLFFLGDPENPEDKRVFENRLHNFMLFMRKLNEKIPILLEKKLEIYIVKKDMPNLTFFIGEKMGSKYGIMYFHNEIFLIDDMPKVAFLTRDEPVLQSLHQNFENDIKHHMVVRYALSDLLHEEEVEDKVIQDLSYNITVRKRFHHFQMDMSLLNTIAKKKSEDNEQIHHLGIEKTPFQISKLYQPQADHDFTKDHHDTLFHSKHLKEKSLTYMKDYLQVDPSQYQVLIGEDKVDLVFNMLIAVEGDLLLPIPSPQEYITLAQKTEDRIIHLPLYFNGVKLTSPQQFEEMILAAKEEGKNPSKLLLNRSSHSFWMDWDKGEIKEFTRICKKHRILVILDGINGDSVEQKNYQYIMEFHREGTVVLSQVSPYLALAGYCVGVAYFPMSLFKIYQTVSYLSAGHTAALPELTMELTLKYLDGDSQVREMLKRLSDVYGQLKTFMENQFSEVQQLDYHITNDGTEVYIDAENYRDVLDLKGIKTNMELAIDLLEKANVVVIPGASFGEQNTRLRFGIYLYDFDGNQIIKNSQEGGTSPNEEFFPRIQQSVFQLLSYFKDLEKE